MRKDLPLGARFAQLIHAAGESSPGSLPPNTHAVALEVADEPELLALEAQLQAIGVPFVAIREPDMDNQLTAIGIQPMVRDKTLRKALAKLALVR